MKVVITENAYADLLRIGTEIKRDNPKRALSFIEELQERCHLIGHMPKAYPLIPNWEEQGIRRRVHGNYLIFYKLVDEKVVILHILHGAQDYAEILFPVE